MARARTQETRQLAVATPKAENAFLLREFSGTEAISSLFEYQLELIGTDTNVPYKDLVGKGMTVRLELGAGGTRYFNGVVSRFAQTESEEGRMQFRATLVPWLWLLTRRSDCRIFQKMTVPDIIKQVFRDQGLTDFEDKLDGTYREWEYCVQYRETDFAFVSRLMEQEGIYYYFRHENAKHVLVLADSTSSVKVFPAYPEVRFKPFDAVLVDYEFIHTWEVERELQPGKFTHTDYDFKAPKKDLLTSCKATRAGAENAYEVFDYPGEFDIATDGEDFASVRLDEYLSRFEVARGGGDCRGLTTGCKFKLVGFRRDDQNKEHLITSTSVSAVSDEFESGSKGGSTELTFSVRFTAIDATQLYRAPRVTPRPVIHGCQTAVVVGKSGEEIWTDEFGRVKVQFHWDRDSAADENSSCWVRVSQPWAGKKWGAVNIPRIGQEVIVEFLEGDPDRPIITGRIYNGDNKPPYDLPSMATVSAMKTNSSKGGGNFNEIRFEDKKDEEMLFVHAAKDHDLRVKNDVKVWVGNDHHVVIKNHSHAKIDGNRHEKLLGSTHTEIQQDRHITIKGKDSAEVTGQVTLKVTGDVVEEFGANHSETTKGDLYIKAKSIYIEASSGIAFKCGGSELVLGSSGATLKGSEVVLDGTSVRIASGPGSPAVAGSAGSANAPDPPEDPLEALEADPGEAAEVAAKKATRDKGAVSAPSVGTMAQSESEAAPEEELGWVAVELKDDLGNPVPGERYRVELPDGAIVEGNLDDKGYAKVAKTKRGDCKIEFPDIHPDEWKRA